MTDRTAQKNTDASRGIGLKAYLTPLGAEKASEMFEANASYREYLEQLTEAPDEKPMFMLRLEQGSYWMGFGACNFYAKAVIDDGVIIGTEGTGFKLGYAYMIRVESDNGDVWQSWDFDEDGSRRAR